MRHYMLMPLYRKGQIVTFVCVDCGDYAAVSRHRWLADRLKYGIRYAHTPNGHKALLLHREIMCPPVELEVDHIDRDPRNNRRGNLRIVTHAQNHQNKGSYPNTLSQYRGVTFDRGRGKWVAKHKLNGRTHNLGRFQSEHEAADAAARFRAEYMPFSAEGRR